MLIVVCAGLCGRVVVWLACGANRCLTPFGCEKPRLQCLRVENETITMASFAPDVDTNFEGEGEKLGCAILPSYAWLPFIACLSTCLLHVNEPTAVESRAGSCCSCALPLPYCTSNSRVLLDRLDLMMLLLCSVRGGCGGSFVKFYKQLPKSSETLVRFFQRQVR